MEGTTPPPPRPPNPALPHREDCWSEGESSVLIDAWGDRYVELNRGNLRQKQWQEVADAVNSRPCDARRPPRTDIQCKNRIDTLKKKYKAEKTKMLDGAPSTHWIFYDRLEHLIGPAPQSLPKKPPSSSSSSPPPPLLALPLPSHLKGLPLPTASIFRPPPTAAAAAAAASDGSDSSSSSSPRSDFSSLERKRRRRRRSIRLPPSKGERFGKEKTRRRRRVGDDGMVKLSDAILRLGEMYGKVEMEKQKQSFEMEKKRFEFIKSLEIQRTEMFVDMQVQLMKLERGGGSSSKDITIPSPSPSPPSLLPFLLQPLFL